VNDRLGFTGLIARMVFRSRAKLFVTGLLVVLLSIFLTVAVLLSKGMQEAATRGAKRLGADLMVVPKGEEIPHGPGLFGGIPIHRSLPDGIERSFAAEPGVMRVAPQYILSSAPGSCCEARNLLLVGFDPTRDVTVLPWLMPDVHHMTGKDSILVGGAVMKASGAAMRFYNHVFTVASRLEKSGSGNFDNAVFIPLDTMKAMESSSGSAAGSSLSVPWGRPSIVLLQLAPSITPQEAAISLERKYPTVRVLAIPDSLREHKLRMERLAKSHSPLIVTAWFFALLVGGGLQLLYWLERRQYMGLLCAFGCAKRTILLCSCCEALIISLVGMVAGSVGALSVVHFFASDFTAITGLPLLTGGISLAVANTPRLWLEFAGAMAVEAAIITCLMLRHETADLLRGA
jgi:putative ABC transport system permease protein